MSSEHFCQWVSFHEIPSTFQFEIIASLIILMIILLFIIWNYFLFLIKCHCLPIVVKNFAITVIANIGNSRLSIPGSIHDQFAKKKVKKNRLVKLRGPSCFSANQSYVRKKKKIKTYGGVFQHEMYDPSRLFHSSKAWESGDLWILCGSGTKLLAPKLWKGRSGIYWRKPKKKCCQNKCVRESEVSRKVSQGWLLKYFGDKNSSSHLKPKRLS